MWLDDSRGHLLEWLTQRWVELTGRRVTLQECPWLEGQAGQQAGLIPDFTVLNSSAFNTGRVSPAVVHFYQRTSEYDLDEWSQRRGAYSTCRVPGFDGRCVRVVFPLPNGNAIVILRPVAHSDGSLTLISSGERFGDPGFYFTVHEPNGAISARYLRSLRESIHVYTAPDGDVRADHALTLWGLPFLRLHYRLRWHSGVMAKSG